MPQHRKCLSHVPKWPCAPEFRDMGCGRGLMVITLNCLLCVCVHVYTCVHTYICTYIYTCVRVCCAYVDIHVDVHLCFHLYITIVRYKQTHHEPRPDFSRSNRLMLLRSTRHQQALPSHPRHGLKGLQKTLAQFRIQQQSQVSAWAASLRVSASSFSWLVSPPLKHGRKGEGSINRRSIKRPVQNHYEGPSRPLACGSTRSSCDPVFELKALGMLQHPKG